VQSERWKRLDFSVRQSGSHKIYKNKEGKRATIPYHSSKILHPKTLKTILRDANLTTDKLIELLRESKWR
jgi:hypothetical protein